MCTAFKYKTYMGRNFDYEISLGEQIITIPANEYDNKYAIIGICTGIVDDYPLLYDGMNEKGLCMAGLAFEGNAGYSENGIPAYDFILRILGKYESVTEFIADKPTVSNEQYKDIPNSDLHWFLCDSERAVIVESIDGEMRIHNALTEVLTNNPPYAQQLELMTNVFNLIGSYPEPPLLQKTRGNETYGLLGDYTSYSRFSRVAYLKNNLEKADVEFNGLTQAFHLLASAEQVYGSAKVGDKFEYTIYSAVYDMDSGALVVRTYDDMSHYHIEFGFDEVNRYDI